MTEASRPIQFEEPSAPTAPPEWISEFVSPSSVLKRPPFVKSLAEIGDQRGLLSSAELTSLRRSARAIRSFSDEPQLAEHSPGTLGVIATYALHPHYDPADLFPSNERPMAAVLAKRALTQQLSLPAGLAAWPDFSNGGLWTKTSEASLPMDELLFPEPPRPLGQLLREGPREDYIRLRSHYFTVNAPWNRITGSDEGGATYDVDMLSAGGMQTFIAGDPLGDFCLEARTFDGKLTHVLIETASTPRGAAAFRRFGEYLAKPYEPAHHRGAPSEEVLLLAHAFIAMVVRKASQLCREEREDLVQDIWLAIRRPLERNQFPSLARLRAYVNQSATPKLRGYYYDRNHSPVVFSDTPLHLAAADFDRQVVDDVGSGTGGLIREVMALCGIAHDSKEGQVVTLFVGHDIRHADVAAALGISEIDSRVTLMRTLRRIREHRNARRILESLRP
jgi:DNA-directed RNA polymerase specialized sigma24 family protein